MTAPRTGRHYGSHESRAIRHAAMALGITPAAMGERVRQRGIHLQVAELIRSAVLTGDHRLAERLFVPIECARLGLVPEPVTPELLDAEQRADAAEDVAQVAFLTDRTPANRRAYINALRTARARSLELLVALEAEEAAAA